MCVRESGKNDDVIATPLVKSVSLRVDTAPTIDSELVREWWPRRAEMCGRKPSSRMRCNSFWLLKVPAAITTWSAVKVRRPRIIGPVCTVSTA